MKPHLQQAERIIVSEQAAKWLSILAEGSTDERAAFVNWLKQSPRNVEEFLFASATWKTFAKPRAGDPAEIERIVAAALAATPSENIVPWIREAGSEDMPVERSGALDLPLAIVPAARRSHRATRWTAGLAAALGLIVFGWTYRGQIASVIISNTYTTDVGEQRTVRLPDGSLVFVNARSRIDVDFSDAARDLQLSEGEAVFKVAHDPSRPFRVRTADALVQAIGTQFNVYRRAEGTTVSVLEGRVRISSSPGGEVSAASSNTKPLQATNLAAGEEASVVPTGRVLKRVEPDVAAAVAWRERRLVFKADRLEDIAAEFARYSPRRIKLKDSAARNTLITGTFDADDPDSLVQFLEEIDDIAVQRDGDNFVVSRR